MDDNPDTRNHRFYRDHDDSDWTEFRSSGPVDYAELEELRTRAAEAGSPALRSCWECNPAHAHFLNTEGDLLISCFACGRYYFNGTDITIYN